MNFKEKIMRQLLNINANWSFLKDTTEIPTTLPNDWECVYLPHTWNNIDGMDAKILISTHAKPDF